MSFKPRPLPFSVPFVTTRVMRLTGCVDYSVVFGSAVKLDSKTVVNSYVSIIVHIGIRLENPFQCHVAAPCISYVDINYVEFTTTDYYNNYKSIRY